MEAERRMALYHKTVAQAYNRTVKPQAFKQGDLVLKVVEHVRRQVSGPSKFAPQWEGPLAVKEVHSSGYYRLISPFEWDPRSVTAFTLWQNEKEQAKLSTRKSKLACS
ncbi:unnamed protein product [Prunus brigantina]